MKELFGLQLAVLILLVGCGERYLDLKPAKNLVILSSLEDYQALLDRVPIFNEKSSHTLALLSIDDYYLESDVWKGLVSAVQRNAHIWQPDIFEGERSTDWDDGYERIFYANIALEGVEKIKPNRSNEQLWKNIKARGLFHRALNHYNLLVLFGEYPDQVNRNGNGIPIRRESDITIGVSRSSFDETIAFIRSDLLEAINLFDNEVWNVERPTKYSALCLLSRLSLYTQDYENAYQYAMSCVEGPYNLLDFNTIDGSVAYPFPTNGIGNSEIIFYTWLPSIAAFAQTRLCINDDLFQLYEDNDLRRDLYFKANQNGTSTFRGGYVGNVLSFTGMSLNEYYLIAMESAVRTDRLDVALSLYNKLREKRYATGKYNPQKMVAKDILLDLVVKEKRKELVMRSSRWEDLKRFNNTPGNSGALIRYIDDVTYTLSPFDPRYTMPIPEYVVDMSGINQNER